MKIFQNEKKLLILVDGSSYLYRAYYAFSFIKKQSSSNKSWAIHGMLIMLRKLLKKYNPTHVAIVFDSKEKTFRKKLFDQYKSQRPLMPKELQKQISPLYNIIKLLGFKTLSIPGVEADDIIGTLAIQANTKKISVLISTTDKDMAQLVSNEILMIDPIKNNILGPEEILEKYGIPPKLIIDFLALNGDRSDNIPGVPGIGKKTSISLLTKIGNLKKIYQNPQKIEQINIRGAKTIKEKILKNKKNAFLYYKLAKIETNIKLKINFNELIIKSPKVKKLNSTFQIYDLKNWIINSYNHDWTKKNKKSLDIVDTIKKNINNARNKQNIITKKKDLIKLNKKFLLEKNLTFNIQLKNSNNNNIKEIIGFSFATENKRELIYIPIEKRQKTEENPKITSKLSLHEILNEIKPILTNQKIKKIGKNLKLHYSIMDNFGIEIKNMAFDITLESYILNSALYLQRTKNKKIKNQKKIGTKNFNVQPKKEFELNKISPNRDYINSENDNAKSIFLLHQNLWIQLKKKPKLKYIFQKIEMPLIKILAKMEKIGVLIDVNKLKEQSQIINNRLIKIKNEAYLIAGEKFNIESSKQLREILFKKLQLKTVHNTPNGIPSTNNIVLKKLMLTNELPEIILKYRSLSKLKSNYIDKFISMVNLNTNRIHTSYYQTTTSTGRLSSRNPNLQNIPINTKDGRAIRKTFIAQREYRIFSADYSQIELRIMAHFSKDKKLIHAFIKEQDIHKKTASEIFNVPFNKVTKEHRQIAKKINFGLIYGISPFGLSQQLNITQKKAKNYINSYFKKYSDILKFIKNIYKLALKQGYIETIEGRRLYLPHINSKNIKLKQSAEREAINAIIQGSAADIIKKSMIKIDKWIKKTKSNVHMLIQVHDELVFEIKKTEIQKSQKIIQKLMEKSTKLIVPLKVNTGIGKNWDEAQSLYCQ